MKETLIDYKSLILYLKIQITTIMIQKSILKMMLGSFCLFIPFILHAQEQTTLDQWLAEDHSGHLSISISGDTLDITTPKGLTLWYKKRLTGEYEIHYNAKVIMQGRKHDRLSDLNCFWGANDPEHPDHLFARSQWRNGVFANYKTLKLFYVGYGGNHNSSTRFRQYLGSSPDTDDSRARPVIQEYTDKQHLLAPNQWYHIRIQVKKGTTHFFVNDELLFSHPLKEKENEGHFGLRLLSNHILFTGFQVHCTQPE